MTSEAISRVAVYCGSNTGNDPAYLAGAAALGTHLAERNIGLVFGGTHKGLMGAVADATLAAGGTAHGVITERLRDKGHLHAGLTGIEILPTMRARKARMIDMANAFIALPGGIGTLEELMEAWTLNQLGEIKKPVGVLDTSGFYQPFLAMIEHMIGQGFLPASHRKALVVTPEPAALIDGLLAYAPVTEPKWMS
ncbi:MAG: TIGR00730 family Rossman fold protein [Pseudomonadota bacterium]